MTGQTREQAATTNRLEAEPAVSAIRGVRRDKTTRGQTQTVAATNGYRSIASQAHFPGSAQLVAGVGARRAVFGTLVAVTVAALAGALATVLAADGFSMLDALLVAALVVEVTWTAHNAWNAILGFLLVRVFSVPTETVFPLGASVHDGDAVVARTAILMTLRNEDCVAAFARMKTIKASVEITGHGAKFDYFILSDSSAPEVIAAEEAAVAEWRAHSGRPNHIHYRRRADNVGYKAGNVFDFCERYGAAYDFMIPLDADSLMTGATIVRLVRIMQANPKIGLLQSLISGTPSQSFFERLLHFGPRHNARLFIFGSSWWQDDSSPFWGHNALIRVAPFTAHCRLPILKGEPPLGGHILSHDQVEAVMMRLAGYEVRVLPEEQGSYEDNPPTVLDFLRRHLRWCQGNLQYLRLRHEPGMLEAKPTHFYLWLALELFFSMGAMVAFVMLAAIVAANWPADVAFPVATAAMVYATWMLIYFIPKIVGTLDAFLFCPQRYGGRIRLLAGSAIDAVATLLLTPFANVVSSIFMIGLIFGQKVTWDGQRRDSYSLPWETATRALWPVTAVGAAMLAFLAAAAPGAIPWFLPFLGGLLLAIPFAVVTSRPRLGEFAARRGILALSEEIETPQALAAVLPWLEQPERTPEGIEETVPVLVRNSERRSRAWA